VTSGEVDGLLPPDGDLEVLWDDLRRRAVTAANDAVSARGTSSSQKGSSWLSRLFGRR
jgi:hypothetical protein